MRRWQFSCNYFSKFAQSEPAKPARKQKLMRNIHSRSCILGSLNSQWRTAYRYITLALSLKFPKNSQRKCWKLPFSTTPVSFDAPLQGTSTNIRINLIQPETRDIGLHFCWRYYGSIFIQIFVVGSKRHIFSATEFVSAIQGRRLWHQSKWHMQLPISH